MPQPKTWVYRYNYHAKWSPEDGEYVATCDEFPSLSYLAKLPSLAVAGLECVVAGVIEDMAASGEPLPLPAK